ncbi:MAG: SpoIIE family protein phosphatase [Thermoanaerobaculia bacterium]
MISRLAATVETKLVAGLDWLSRSLLPALQLPVSPSADAALLALRQIRAENRFFVHAGWWASTCLLLIALNLTDGSREPWSLIATTAWGAVVALHGHRAWRRRRTRLLIADHPVAAANAAGAEAVDQDPDDAPSLRARLMSSAEEARDALRSVSPETLAEVTRGETRALKLVSWLTHAERLSRSFGVDRELRRDTATRLADADTGGAFARKPFEDLLRELDSHGQRLGSVEQQSRDRRARVESFLLALEGVRIASAGGADPAAVTAPLRERVALLEETESCGDEISATPAQTANAALRFREEVRLAQDLQRSILPAAAPQVPGLTVAHVYRPSNEIGGDFYDFYDLGGGRLLVAVGDASGHGIDSSMVSSMAKSAVYMQIATGRGERPGGLAEAMAQINRMMCDTLGRRRLMTLTLLEIDTGGQRISWVNAGHVYPLLRRGDRVRELEQPGYPLGVRREMVYQVDDQALEPGDLLILLTDGYVEALDGAGEPLGWEPLTDRLCSSRAAGVEALLAEITGDLDHHLQGASPQDDVTLIALCYEP